MTRILIVEDKPEIRSLIRMTLEFADAEIHEAASAEEGWRQVGELQPQVLLLDVMMPGGVDGLALCRRIKTDPRTRRIKVVMLSARGQPSDLQAGRDAGADDYLVKPFSPRELLKVVNRLR